MGMCGDYLCYDIMGYIWDNLVVGAGISECHVTMIERLLYELTIIIFVGLLWRNTEIIKRWTRLK